MHTFLIGIDPGLNGAVALYDPVAKQLLGVWDIPVTKSKNSKGKNRSQINLAELTKRFKDLTVQNLWSPGPRYVAILEQVTAAPGQGATSMFNFGQGYGMLRGILATLNIDTLLVRPGVWKPAMGLSSNKQHSIEKAKTLFGPDYFNLKKHDGRAEASLLAVYGARSIKQQTVQDLY